MHAKPLARRPVSWEIDCVIDTLDRVKRLIVNADDFGLTSGVNRAIVDLHQLGKMTSTTLMAVAGATTEAVLIPHQLPKLGVGCHVVLVDGSPVLPPAQLPTLVDPATGRFRSTLGKFVRDLFLNRIRASEIEAEAAAQIARLQSIRVPLTHVDTHKHTHIFPRVLAPLLAAARRHQIPAIRNPFEPGWSLAATPAAPLLRRAQVHLLSRFHGSFLKLVANAGLITTDGAVGVLATGTLNPAALASLLRAIPDGTWELVTHPGYNDADLAKAGTRLLASREIELAALSAASFPSDVELIHFGDLIPRKSG
jgi:hopanoid biosynthesis associated protein HpnK